MSTTSQDGAFVWHDLMSTNRNASERFFESLLGWEVEVVQPMDYHMLKTGDASFGGVNAWDREGIPSHWIGYIQVPNVEEAGSRVAELGGKVIDGPHDLPTVGRMSVISDPQGGMFLIFEKADAGMSMNENVAEGAEGKVLWNELMTTDVESAKSFYGELFGWGFEIGDVGTGQYTMATVNGTPIAGIMQKPDEFPVVAWVFYFKVTDIDAALAKATELGGQVMMPPMEVPTVGKFAWVADPAGAPTPLLQPPASE